MIRFFLTLSIIILFSVSKGFSQIIDSSFFGWTIYELQKNEFEEKKCYMVNYPVKSESDHNSRIRPYIMITRYKNKRVEEFSIYSGFEYRLHSKVFVSIDDQIFQMTTNEDMAWAKTKKEDAVIIQKILNSANLKTRADSSIATFAVDEYSLKGVTRAYSRLKSICE